MNAVARPSVVHTMVLFGACFLAQATVVAMLIGAPQLALDLGVTKGGLGILGGVGSGSYMLTCLWTGRLSDRIGRKALPLVGSGVIACGLLYMPHADNLAELCVFRAVAGVGHGMFWPSIEAWFGDEAPNGNILRAVGHFNIAWSTGDIISPILWGKLYDIHPTWLFHASAALAAAPVLGLGALRGPRSLAEAHHAALAPHPRWRTFLQAAWIANFCSYLTNGLVTALFPELARQYGYFGEGAGKFLALAYATRLAAFVVATYSFTWLYRARLQAGWQLASVVGLLLVAIGSNGWWFGVGFLLIGLTLGLSYSASMFYSLAAPRGRGGRTAIHEIYIGTGMAAGPILGGWAAEVTNSLRAPYYLGGLALLVGVVVQAWLFIRARPPAQQGSKAPVG